MEILIAEDEIRIAESLKKNFLQAGHHALIAKDGEETLNVMEKIQFDVLLLDWRMPKLSGLEVCRKIRSTGSEIPIILLTALTDISNKVEALDAGADDYITKPFSFDEVMARINAVARRYKSSVSTITFGDNTLNLITRIITTPKAQIKLTDKEFDLLKFFLDNKGTIISKESICEKVWDLPFTPQTNIVEAAVKNLRKKLEEAIEQKFIKTIYGEGYIFFGD
ncbi:MAG: response regulator transcription factor [Ignavibacteriales bacterium]|nr:response regulator transcription factor [Ignavibacteriales bacterium]